MTSSIPYPENDPRHQSFRIKKMLRETLEHVRRDGAKISDPRGQALFEVSAEVLGGLLSAYDNFEHRDEGGVR